MGICVSKQATGIQEAADVPFHKLTQYESILSFGNLVAACSAPASVYSKDALKEAAKRLGEATPVFCSKFVRNPENPLEISLQAASTSDSLPWIDHGSMPSLDEMMQASGAAPLMERPFAFHVAACATDATRVYAALVITHGLSDGVCTFPALNRWLRAVKEPIAAQSFRSYTALYRDPTPEKAILEPLRVPPKDAVWEPTPVDRTTPIDFTQPGAARMEHLRVSMPLGDLGMVLAACRARSVSLQGALYAASVAAMLRLKGPEIFTKRFVAGTSCDGRKRIRTDPPISTEDLTLAAFYVPVELQELTPSKCLWNIATQGMATLRQELKSLDAPRSFFHRGGMLSEVANSSTIVTLGRLAAFPEGVTGLSFACFFPPSPLSTGVLGTWLYTAPAEGLVCSVAYLAPAYPRAAVQQYAETILDALKEMTAGNPALGTQEHPVVAPPPLSERLRSARDLRVLETPDPSKTVPAPFPSSPSPSPEPEPEQVSAEPVPEPVPAPLSPVATAEPTTPMQSAPVSEPEAVPEPEPAPVVAQPAPVVAPDGPVAQLLRKVEARDSAQTHFLQAVHEVVTALTPVFERRPEAPLFLLSFVSPHFLQSGQKLVGVMERLLEPERSVVFRVPWLDDTGKVQVNRGFRVEFNSAIGPYKGGLRFHPSVTLSIIKFLGFEQIFKNALTTLPMGGGKGGSDFNPKGKSRAEVMRFCQSFMTELSRHIGPDTDVPAGDIGVGGREIGFLFGQYKRLGNQFCGVLTGKGAAWGGSLIRPEATGFGLVYFVREMLKAKGDDLRGKNVAISGFGNVAWGAALKATELGACVVTVSGPDGCVHAPAGLQPEMIDALLELRSSCNDVVAPLAERFPEALTFQAGRKAWETPCDIALPCACENEVALADAEALVRNGCQLVAEGSIRPDDR